MEKIIQNEADSRLSIRSISTRDPISSRGFKIILSSHNAQVARFASE
jgi:hypothetical protein